MLATPGETHYPATTPSQKRLGAQLADVIPGAVAIRVSLADPRRQWPHPYTVAVDLHGEPLPLSRTTTKTVARWVLRTWPDADWTRPHTLDLTTGQLAIAAGAMVRGR